MKQAESIQIREVVVQGLERSDPEFVRRQFREVAECKDLECVRRQVEQIRGYFEQMELFKHMDFSLQRGSAGKALVFKVQENRLKVFTGTEWLPNNRMAVCVRGTLFNVFGRGERLRANVRLGESGSVNVVMAKPMAESPGNSLNWSLHRDEARTGAGVFYDLSTSFGLHQIKYDLSWKSDTIRSSATHSLTRERLDDHLLPTSGHRFRMTSEIAGLGGHDRFVRSEIQASQHMPILGVALSVTGRSRFLVPLGGWKSGLADLYSIGGPSSVRGMEPIEAGGEASIEAGVSCSAPVLPSVRAQVYINGGNVTRIDNVRSLASGVGVSCGVGLMLRVLGMARLEVNVNYPLRVGRHQVFKARFPQIGLGVDFL